MTAEQKQKDMLETPVSKLIPRLAVPTIISMLVTSFYNMADTYFVGTMENPSATGAVGVVFSFMSIIQAIGFMFGHGSGTFLSRALGKGDREKAEQMSSSAFFYSLLVGAVVTVIGLAWMEPLCYLLGSTDTILPFAKQYIAYILISAPYMMASLVLNNQLRFQGSATFAMIGIVSGAVLNIGLDALFIMVFGWGVRGAAIATAIGQAVSFVLLFIGTMQKGNIHVSFKKIRVRLWVFKEILRGGVPSLFRQGLASVSAIALNTVAGSLGQDYAIAGMSIVSRVMMFANSAIIGFGQGMQPVAGFNYGAKKYERVREGFWFCTKWATVVLVGIGVVGFIFAEQIVGLFQSNEKVIEVAKGAMRFQCVSFVASAFIVPANMMLQSVGKVVPASILAASRNGILFLPPLFILTHFFGITGLQLSQSVADVLTLLLAVPFTAHFFKELKKKTKA